MWNTPTRWEASAEVAIAVKGYDHQPDWSLARTLLHLEGYNGYGSYAKGINSHCFWSLYNLYTSGKFVADHKYDPTAVSDRCGAPGMLKALVTLATFHSSE